MSNTKWCISVIDESGRDFKKPTRVRGNRTFNTKKEALQWTKNVMDKTHFKKAYPVKYNPNHKDYAPRFFRGTR